MHSNPYDIKNIIYHDDDFEYDKEKEEESVDMENGDEEAEKEEEPIINKIGSAENCNTPINILECGQNIEIMLSKILEAQTENSANQIFGYEKVIIEKFRALPENVKLSKFNAIIDILEK